MECSVEPLKRNEVILICANRNDFKDVLLSGSGGSFHTLTHIMLCKSTLWKELESTVSVVSFEEWVGEGW